MKNKILTTAFALAALFIANQASAYYSPSTGRWLSRDPMGETSFETLRAASVVPGTGQAVSAASLPPSRLFVRDPVEQPVSNFQAEDNESVQDQQANSYNFANNEPVSQWDYLGLEDTLTISGGSPHTSPIRHNKYLTFIITCPKCTEFTLIKIDYSGIVPGLIAAGYSPSYIASLGELGGLRDNKTPNCRGNAVTLNAFMRSRLSFYGSGTPAYVAGTIIEYSCLPCSRQLGCCGPVLIP
jgi:hypothetical protein